MALENPLSYLQELATDSFPEPMNQVLTVVFSSFMIHFNIIPIQSKVNEDK
jgi:hypothetical protein